MASIITIFVVSLRIYTTLFSSFGHKFYCFAISSYLMINSNAVSLVGMVVGMVVAAIYKPLIYNKILFYFRLFLNFYSIVNGVVFFSPAKFCSYTSIITLSDNKILLIIRSKSRGSKINHCV